VYIVGGDVMRGRKSTGTLGCFHLCFVPVRVPCGNNVIGYKIVHKELIVNF